MNSQSRTKSIHIRKARDGLGISSHYRNPFRVRIPQKYNRESPDTHTANLAIRPGGSMKISRRNPCSPFFSVSYSINRHKIIQYLFSIIVLIQYYTASWVGQGSAVRVSASYSIVIALRLLIYMCPRPGVLTVWYLCSVKIGLKYMHWLLRSTHLCFRYSFDDVTRINFRFRLLVTWSSAHGRDASSRKIWCRYLYPMRSY